MSIGLRIQWSSVTVQRSPTSHPLASKVSSVRRQEASPLCCPSTRCMARQSWSWWSLLHVQTSHSLIPCMRMRRQSSLWHCVAFCQDPYWHQHYFWQKMYKCRKANIYQCWVANEFIKSLVFTVYNIEKCSVFGLKIIMLNICLW